MEPVVPVVASADLTLGDGRVLRVHDTGGGPADADDDRLAVVWHHGTGNTGEPPAPLLGAAASLGLRFVGFDRPAYGGSTELPGRSIGDVARDVEALADHLGLRRFAVMGHSGGGPHALACGALLRGRVTAVVDVSGPAPLAPMQAEGRDWYSGFAPFGVASLRAAEQGRAAREDYEEHGTEDDFGFTSSDEAALEGSWSWFLEVVRTGSANGPGPMIDDDLATVSAWGADVEDIVAPTLVVHGADDRVVPATHGEWVAAHVPGSTLWVERGDGHISVLRRATDALEWLRENTSR